MSALLQANPVAADSFRVTIVHFVQNHVIANVLPILEEIGFATQMWGPGISEDGVYIAAPQSGPAISDRLRVTGIRAFTLNVETDVLATFEEVDLSVIPNNCGINPVRPNPGPVIGDGLGGTHTRPSIYCSVILDVFFAFEEIGFPIIPGTDDYGVNPLRPYALPVAGDGLGVIGVYSVGLDIVAVIFAPP